MSFLEKVLNEKYNKDLSHEDLGKLLEEKWNELAKERDTFKSTSEKNASEAANFKKQLQEKMTDEEKKEADIQELRKQYDVLVKEKNVAKYTSEYLSLDYNEELAKQAAQAQADGDYAKLFEIQKQHKANVEENYKKQQLEKTPKPNDPKLGDPTKITKEDFNKMGYEDRVKLYETNRQLYDELSK